MDAKLRHYSDASKLGFQHSLPLLLVKYGRDHYAAILPYGGVYTNYRQFTYHENGESCKMIWLNYQVVQQMIQTEVVQFARYLETYYGITSSGNDLKVYRSFLNACDKLESDIEESEKRHEEWAERERQEKIKLRREREHGIYADYYFNSNDPARRQRWAERRKIIYD